VRKTLQGPEHLAKGGRIALTCAAARAVRETMNFRPRRCA
jgi:hypothetical protein